MKLPRQVQEQEDRSNKAIEDWKAQNTAVADPPQSTPPADPPPQAPPAPPVEPKDEWKAKYAVLQGKYNAEVPRLHADLKAANAKLDTLTSEVEQLKAKAVAAPPPVPQHDALADKFGGDTVAMVRQIAAEAAAEVRGELQPIKTQVEQTSQQATRAVEDSAAQARNAFFAALTTAVSDWRTIDEDERWQAFLAEKDRFARRPRQELLTDAFVAGDLEGVVAFFDAFKESIAPPPVVAPPTPPTPDPQAALAAQLTPDPSGRSAAPQDKKIYTRAEVSAFYKGVALGKYRPDQAAAIENEINLAARENRIR